jgi:hypothetical protein
MSRVETQDPRVDGMAEQLATILDRYREHRDERSRAARTGPIEPTPWLTRCPADWDERSLPPAWYRRSKTRCVIRCATR